MITWWWCDSDAFVFIILASIQKTINGCVKWKGTPLFLLCSPAERRRGLQLRDCLLPGHSGLPVSGKWWSDWRLGCTSHVSGPSAQLALAAAPPFVQQTKRCKLAGRRTKISDGGSLTYWTPRAARTAACGRGQCRKYLPMARSQVTSLLIGAQYQFPEVAGGQ